MERRYRLLFIAFIESFATILLERGFYFYTRDILHFEEYQNLMLALMFGVIYVFGAVLSHRIAHKISEKYAFFSAVSILLLTNLMIFLFPNNALIVISFGIIAFVTGAKWPILESYISAGQTPRHVLRIIGYFSLSWAGAAPLALVASGFLIGSDSPTRFFATAASIHALTLFACIFLKKRPVHLAENHPERLPSIQLHQYKHLLKASRMSMLSSYALLFLLAPLMPTIFSRLNFDVQASASLSGLLDVMRFVAFLILGFFATWHGRSTPVFLMIFALPLGFFMVLFGSNIYVVLVGEILFGLASGLMYYGSLYYALILQNSAVNAGGEHEGLIGTGFALGPLIGLIGLSLSNITGNTWGMLIGVTPIIVLCIVLALNQLWHLHQFTTSLKQNSAESQ
ncbi:MFS transporter [Planctomycetota bacterium]|nr:MFS transporter [Planctomycetota bacterium]